MSKFLNIVKVRNKKKNKWLNSFKKSSSSRKLFASVTTVKAQIKAIMSKPIIIGNRTKIILSFPQVRNIKK